MSLNLEIAIKEKHTEICFLETLILESERNTMGKHPQNMDKCHTMKNPASTVQNEKDPVCEMTVTPQTAEGESVFKGAKYYFCSLHCKSEFDQHPDQYLMAKKITEFKSIDIEFTCPMHPQILQIGPGNCPICGMSLEPVTVTSGAEDDSEFKMMLKRFWVSAALSVPLLFITMGG
ncbi:MAG: YHS domain-containing protein, partial [Bdellovibrionota bacterium]